MVSQPRTIEQLCGAIVACERCPRLIKWCREVARTKVRRFQDQEYWGKPVPGFGDPGARLLVVGLAPAAHGGNRTGRVFTGDSSGDWLYEALHRFGFANQAASVGRGDGLRLLDCYVTAAARCAPPGNRPTARELAKCRPWLESELALLPGVRVVIALGKIAHDAYIAAAAAFAASAAEPSRGFIRGGETMTPLPASKLAARRSVAEATARPRFAHGALSRMPDGTILLSSYHPSRQNTNTGRLTRPMWHAVFRRARALVDGRSPAE